MSVTARLKKESLIQSIWPLGIALLTAVVLWPLAPSPNPHPSGILLPAAPLGQVVRLSSSEVTVFQVFPPAAQVVGTISTQIHYDAITPEADQMHLSLNMNLVRTLAAEAGANGVVVTEIGRNFKAGPLDEFVVQATAIRTPK